MTFSRLLRGFLAPLTSLLVCLCLVSPAGSGCLSCLGVGGPSAAASPPVVTFQSSDGSATGGGTVTFTSSVPLAIGAAFANRRVIVVATGGQGSATLTACTIQGISCDATSIVSLGTGGSGNQNKVFTASAVVPTGTTATIVGTFSSAAFSQTRIAVYTVDTTLLSSVVPVGAYAETAGGTTLNQSVTASANGFILAAFTTGGAPGTVTVVSSPVGMSMDVTVVAGVDAYAHENGVSSGSNSVTFNWVNSLISGIGLLAFR